MNKSWLSFGFRSIFLVIAIFSFVLLGATGVEAASTIGDNMSTTGTFTTTASSATAVRFQNAAGTNFLIIDTTNSRVGIGATPQTMFEVQGTASATYFLTGNTLQVGGYGSVAYSRFGTSATTHSDFITTTNDLVINGDFEVDGKAFFDGTASVASNFEVAGTASISGIFNLKDGQIRPQDNGATAFRFQNAAGATTVLTIDTTNFRVGIGGTPQTTFEVQGTASASYFLTGNSIQVAGFASVAYSRFGTATTGNSTIIDATNDLLISGGLEVNDKAFLDATASVGGAFEVIGRASASTGFVTGSFVVGNNVASSSTAYLAEFGAGKTGTISILFGSSTAAATTGTCFQMKNSVGDWVYARVFGTTFTVNTTKCHP